MSEKVRWEKEYGRKVTLRLGGKAVVSLSGGEADIGTWEDRPRNPGYGYVFRGRTHDGKQSEWMKKRELREWFAKECSK